MLTVEEAKQRICDAVPRLPAVSVPLGDAAGRVLAEPAVATRTLPPWDNSAMDGFAVRAAELPATLPVAGTIAAGDPPDAELAPGTVLRIMTGAPMPAGADAVVMRENVDDRGDTATFADPAPLGRHIRRAGEDVAVGASMLPAGVILGPGEIGLLAAQGFAEVIVARKPRVAILSTGDELVDVGVAPGPGQIVNSNAYALAAQVREAGGEPIMAGIAPDQREPLIAMLRDALEADVLLTSGGVSVGDFDFVKEAFEEVGVSVDFWKVAMKPGKPLAFGVSSAGKPVFGLPGNPVSTMIGFELFGRPALLRMQGAAQIDRPQTQVTLTTDYKKSPGRKHYVRAKLSRTADTLVADLNRKQGSGMLTSMIDLDALVVLDIDLGDVAAGTRVPALLLRPV